MFQINDRRSTKFVGLETRHSPRSLGRSREAIRCIAFVFALMFAAVPTVLAAESAGNISGVVNINTASSAELQLLPGVGEKRAEAIMDIRKSKGGFSSVDELVIVKGLGEAMLDRMRPHVTLKGKTTARRL